MDTPHITLLGEKLFSVCGLEITNTHFLGILCAVFIFIFFFMAIRKKEIVPNKFQNIAEWIIESIFNFFDGITGDRKKTEEIFPLSATIFLLVLCSNLLEILPGVGVFHQLRSPSSDITFTFAISVFSMVYIHVMALKQLGVFSYLKKYICLNNPIMFFVGILEAMGELTRTFSLGVRLFGNLFAGEILLMIVAGMFPLLLPLPFLGLEVFVGLIQAIIFSSLVAIFYVVTVAEAEHG